MNREPCVGCGAMVPAIIAPTHRYIGASPGCWAEYGRHAARPWADGQAGAHQLVVDTYAVQHPGTPSPQSIQSVAVHLLSLHAVFAVGRAPDLANITRNRGLRHKGVYRWLDPPSFEGSLTVLDVNPEGGPATYARQADAWARSVWNAWTPHHPTIAEWHGSYVG